MTDNFGPTVQLPCYEVRQLAQLAQKAIQINRERRMDAAIKKYKSSRIKLLDFIFGEPTEQKLRRDIVSNWCDISWHYPSREVVDVLCDGLLDKAPGMLVTVSVDDLRYMRNLADSLESD